MCTCTSPVINSVGAAGSPEESLGLLGCACVLPLGLCDATCLASQSSAKAHYFTFIPLSELLNK